MSATNRGSARLIEDQYFTRYPVAFAICEKLKEDLRIEPRSILEPSAGAGAFVSAAAEVFKPKSFQWNDIRTSLMLKEHRERASEFCPEVYASRGDYLKLKRRAKVDLVIGNPPYDNAEQHIRHSIPLLSQDGYLAFLLRLNFLAGIERGRGLWQDHPPLCIYPLDKRPTFKEGWRIDKRTKKKVKVTTDSCEYGVFVWKKTPPPLCDPEIRWLRWSPYLKVFKNKVERIFKE